MGTMRKQLRYFLVLQRHILHYYCDAREVFDAGVITNALITHSLQVMQIEKAHFSASNYLASNYIMIIILAWRNIFLFFYRD